MASFKSFGKSLWRGAKQIAVPGATGLGFLFGGPIGATLGSILGSTISGISQARGARRERIRGERELATIQQEQAAAIRAQEEKQVAKTREEEMKLAEKRRAFYRSRGRRQTLFGSPYGVEGYGERTLLG